MKQYYKFINVFEKDGITEKEDTSGMPYSEFKGLIMEEVLPTEVGKKMMMNTVDRTLIDGYFRTSTVENTLVNGKQMTVVTRNTIYKFEIINTYEG